MKDNHPFEELNLSLRSFSDEHGLAFLRATPEKWGAQFVVAEISTPCRCFLIEVDYRDRMVSLWLACYGNPPEDLGKSYNPKYRNAFECHQNWLRKRNATLSREKPKARHALPEPKGPYERVSKEFQLTLDGLAHCLTSSDES